MSFSFLKQASFCLLIASSVLVNLNVFCQAPQLVKVTPPSPNAQAMQKYGDIPVSEYTGIPNISIPLYTAKFRDITVPISINYHASGIKVAEDASQVGLGWSLNAGGSISRNIIGEDDFKGTEYFNGTNNNIADLSDGQLPRNLLQFGCVLPMVNRTIPNSPTLYNLDLSQYLDPAVPYEFQPDQYFFNFLNHSGKFVLKRNKQAILEKQERMDFTVSHVDSVWQVKSTDGYIYDFTQFETCEDLQGSASAKKTAWYLTKITSPLGNTVTFNYTIIPNRYITTIGAYSESVDAHELPTFYGNNVWFSTNLGTQKGMAPAKNYTHIVLNSIDFTSGLVQFYYSDNRLDLPGDQRLDSISVFSRNNFGTVSTIPFKTITFSYSYFSVGDIDNDYSKSNQGADANYKRLKLTQVSEKGYSGTSALTMPPYIFSYNEGGTLNLPSKASFARDHWGYYNGKVNNTSLIPSILPVNSPDYITSLLGLPGPERDADTAYARAFSLASITYPTGGSTEFQYESNDFDEAQSMVNDHSFFNYQASVQSVTKTLVYDNVGKTFITSDTADLSDEYVYVNQTQTSGFTQNVHLQFTVRFNSSSANVCSFGSVGMLTFDVYDSAGSDILSKDYQYFSQCSGTNSNNCLICGSAGGLVATYNTDLTLGPGKYKVAVHVANSITTIQDIRFAFTYYTETTTQGSQNSSTTGYYSYGGGLRVKRIYDHDGISSQNDKVRKFLYHYFQDKNNDGTPEEYSFGRRMMKPQYNSFEWSDEFYTEHANSLTINVSYQAAHFMRNSDSNVPLNGSAGGAVVGYDQVTVLEGENGENGKTVYSYHNQPDFVSSYIQNGDIPSRPPFGSSLPDPQNGNLISQVEYKNVGGQFFPTKSVSNTYSLIDTKENRVYGLDVRIPKLFNWGDGHTFAGSGTPPICDLYLYGYVNLQSEWIRLDRTDEKVYNVADTTQYITNTTFNYYDNPNHYLLTRKTVSNSKGEAVTSHIQYPFDYTNVSATDAFTKGIKSLQTAHIYETPVEQYTELSNSDGSNKRVKNGGVIAFQTTKPLPSLIYNTHLSSPSTSFVPSATTSAGFSMDDSYDSLISLDKYNANGNIIQQHKVNDVLHSYIWGYNNSFPVAEVVNAASNEIQFKDFEHPGWDANMQYDFSFSHSGSASGKIVKTTAGELYSMSNTWLNIDSGKVRNFRFSGWFYSNGPTVDLYLFMKKAGETGYFTFVNSVSTGVTNKWVFLQQDYSVPSNITQLNVRVDNNGGGTVWFDDVRLYPSNAQMTTYTYNPLTGMTSQADANNKFLYYEYDSLGRLAVIKDQDGNVLKTFDYNYKH